MWLYSTVQPSSEIAKMCERVVVRHSPLRLVALAQRELWPMRAALAVGAWTGDGSWVLKLCPLLVPPFRSLFLNRSGDFLRGTPGPVAAHFRHGLRESLHNRAVRGAEIASDTWQLLRHHIWRSGPVTRVKDYAGAAGLATVASLLRWSGYPHRRLFPKLHGAAVLDAAPSRGTAAEGTVAFYQRDPDWNAAAIGELARSADARWLVWHNGSGPGAIDDLLPLFDDPATFAVSRQSSYRAWKPVLLPTAPFRTLQPGERTQLMAP
ncbi:MAG TPA: hypothetical protein VNV86_01345, partial [Candidatus Acidoferrum sp.]|nr:hypothetical protein [Candidatus Acidoferrum sp.]